jgi:hypothetical protein
MMKRSFSFISALAILVFMFIGCSGDTVVGIEDPNGNGNDPGDGVAVIDEGTTELSGPMRGTLRAGRTYQLVGDLIIPAGEEIVAEEGVTIIAVGDGGPIGPEITVHGSFISLGTEQNPNFFTVPAERRTLENIFAGLWGGLQASETARAIVLKWTRMEFVGGEGGPGTPRAGSIRYGLWTLSDQTEVVIEDSWFLGAKDDFFRPVGGKLNIVRNTFEFMGEDGGDIINVKGGTVGNIAYNVVIGGATNAFKPSDDGASTIQSNIAVYNNTILNSGFRRVGLNRGANINFENGARGSAHNNLLVNNKRGLRIVEDTDVANLTYSHNWYYGAHQAMVDEFLPTDAITEWQDGDVYGGAGENDPMFVSYDVTRFTMADYEAGENQPTAMNRIVGEGHDLRLQPGSPALGAGTTNVQRVNVSWTLSGSRAPSVLPPSPDMGAYPADGSGNRHHANSPIALLGSDL